RTIALYVYDSINYSIGKAREKAGTKFDIQRAATRGETNMNKQQLFVCISLCYGLVAAAPAYAQSYPDKPIKIIVAAAPAVPTDVPARLAAQILTPKLGQPVVVENRAGAGGAIGAREVAKAAPDGYTLFMGNTSTLAVIPAVSTGAGYDPVKNFTPIVK